MKLIYYLNCKKLPIACCIIAQLVIGFILFVSGVKASYATFILGLITTLTCVCLAVEYTSGKMRIERINKTLASLSDEYLIGEVLPKPKNELEAAYYSVMKVMSHSVVDKVEAAERAKAEYCEYVESWIHEIKTPLTACSLILENGGDVSKLKRELKRADNMTETILCYARLSSAEKDRVIRRFNVADVIDADVKSQMPLLIAANTSVEVDGDFTVSSDDKALSFIISQLLVNSAKYCPGCKIKITSANGVVTYEDNGIGIPSHELPRITQRGFTGTNGRKLGSSTGMGLYIVAALCKDNGITLKSESEIEKFTRFTLSYDSLTKM